MDLTIFGIRGTFTGWVDDRIWLVQNGVVPTNPTGFTLNYIDHIDVQDMGVHGFGCNFRSWTTSMPDCGVIINTTVLRSFPKIWGSLKCESFLNLKGYISHNYGLRWFGSWTNSSGSSVNSGISSKSDTQTIDGGYAGLNEYMIDFTSIVNSRDNFGIRGIVLTGIIEWSDGDRDGDVNYILRLSNCNMWMTR